MGVIVLDAGVVIGVLDADDAHHPVTLEALRSCLERRDSLVVPASVYAETLVGPYRCGADAADVLDGFYSDLGVNIQPITEEIAHEAARTRAVHGNKLRLPDALVVATAHQLNAAVLTTYARWPADVSVEVTVIDAASSVTTRRERH